MMPNNPAQRGAKRPITGKRVVFVTPHAVAAKEEEEKYKKMNKKTEIKKEKDDTGTYVYVVYVFEGMF